MAYQKLTTVNGHDLFQCASAFQKMVRRGSVDDSLYWGIEMDKSGYGEYLWKRMLIISSEDIGMAEPYISSQIWSLYQMYTHMKKVQKNDPKHNSHRMFLTHSIILLASSKKNRMIDNAMNTFYKTNEFRPIPDVALDRHTIEGKRKGRGFDHFFDEGCKLENPGGPQDTYRDKAREILKGMDKNTPQFDKSIDNGIPEENACEEEKTTLL